MKELMTGNEALARGAYEAGVRFASAYPGTPSTEILENTALYKESIVAQWANNEKVALEAAAGASVAGARAFAAMKHVGVNVAADPLFTFAYTGVNGGFVLITADEPGQHSSQNEQDNRNYAKFAKIPCIEPKDAQECKDFMKRAFELSEAYDTPVLLRVTTRVCHSKGIVDLAERKEVPIKEYQKDAKKYVTVPAHARILRAKVEERLQKLARFANETALNRIEYHSKKIGVVASGSCIDYAREVFGEEASYLMIGFSFPMPTEKMKEFAKEVETLYVIEENDPIIEEEMQRLGLTVHGKDTFPAFGELTPDVLRQALYGKTLDAVTASTEHVVPRPPSLCAGCPHRGLFYEIGKLKNTMISGDIGCYTLGFAEPYNAMDINLCMGAGISVGHGAQTVFDMDPENKKRVITVMGDSTFFHTGVNSLINTAYNGSNTINIILDNRITGMTGHQENPGSGYTLQGKKTQEVDLTALVKACGIEHVITINPNDLAAVKNAVKWAESLEAPSVIITRWPCVLKKLHEEDKAEFVNVFKEKCYVDQDTCIGCRACTRTGCPAIEFDYEKKKSFINRNACVGCTVCLQVCPVKAIKKEGKN
ncbi:Indolepyruvate oxidoreductase subunit IorA [Clostridiaceae bacterium JG1575]|nr:Indolepyruvate oxidoreductase subunit IorA [Clostridiaceae bacterium JG1575]